MTIPKIYMTKVENGKIILTKSDMPHTIEEGNKKFGPNARFCEGCIIDYAATGYKNSVEEKLGEISKYLEDYKNDGKIPNVKFFETYNVMMYEFRHYVELKFKSFIYQNLRKNPETIHGLNELYNKFEDKIIKGKFKDDIKDIVTYITNVEGTPDYFRYLSDKNFEEITNIYEIDLDIDVRIKQFLETMNKFKHFIDDYNSSLNKIKGLNVSIDEQLKYRILREIQRIEPTLRLTPLSKLYTCNETKLNEEWGIIYINIQILKDKTFYKIFKSNYQILKENFDKECE